MLGLRFKGDLAVGRRFETLTRELGDAFIKVEFDGIKHSTLTLHRQQEGVGGIVHPDEPERQARGVVRPEFRPAVEHRPRGEEVRAEGAQEHQHAAEDAFHAESSLKHVNGLFNILDWISRRLPGTPG